MPAAHSSAESPPPRLTARISRFELLLIFGFWALIGVLSSVNTTLNPLIIASAPAYRLPPIIGGLVECLVWALLTPLIFHMTRRYSLDHPRWLLRLAAFILIGIVVALCVYQLMAYIRGSSREFFTWLNGRGQSGKPATESETFFTNRLWVLYEFAVYLFLMMAGVAGDYYARYRASRSRVAGLNLELAQARLGALQSQLNPHFLFNTLNGVASLIERDPRRAQDMIADLAALLRETLARDELEITLARELQLIRRYVGIMQARFGSKLQFDEHIDPAAENALVPTLILQPLVENAIKYGVEHSEGGGSVQIEAQRVGGNLVLNVRNDGRLAGRNEPARGTGLGLRNTRARLNQSYGERQSLVLHQESARHVCAAIRLPFHTESQGVAQ
ncbi:MAG: sensor histidine kinase [Steroidobacteraceae bacterium]